MQAGLKFQAICGSPLLTGLDIWSQLINLKEHSVCWVISLTTKDNGDNDLNLIGHISTFSYFEIKLIT